MPETEFASAPSHAPAAGNGSGPQDEFLSARQAAELLGVKLPTVYA